MLEKMNTVFFVLIFTLLSGCSSKDKPEDESVFTIHGISIGTSYDKAEKTLKDKGFLIFEDEGKNFVEYRLNDEKGKSSLKVLYNSKNNNGQIYSIGFSTITENYSSLEEAELLLKKMFGEKLRITKRKSTYIIALSSEEISYGSISMQAKAYLSNKIIGSVKLKNGARGLN